MRRWVHDGFGATPCGWGVVVGNFLGISDIKKHSMTDSLTPPKKNIHGINDVSMMFSFLISFH